jgi:hypothetical protein
LVGLLSGTQRDDREISALFGRGLRTPAISKAANLAIKYRSADGHFDRLSAMGRRSRGRPHRRDHCARPAGCSVAKAATATIPIIFATGADPVELGLVSSVNPPGDNVTGVTFLSTHSGQTVGVAARARRRDCARWQALGVVPAELSRLFRRLFLERLTAAHNSFSSSAITRRSPMARPSPRIWRRCARPNGSSIQSARSADPTGLSLPLYHRVAIANSRLIAFDKDSITFKWKDYRIEGRDRYKRMTPVTDEFIRRFRRLTTRQL